MYQGFQLQGFNELFFQDNQFDYHFDYYKEIGKASFEEDRAMVKGRLESYLLSNNRLDGKAMEDDWFPKIRADVFLSHSHRDEDLVFALAGWLKKEMNLRAFVDSGVWGYADDLLREVDDEYCAYRKNGEKFYDYSKRNISTSHVHMMLSVALTKMINQCECFMLIHTPESIMFSEAVREEKTLSPWIYAELSESHVIRRNTPERYQMRDDVRHGLFSESSTLSIEYPAPVDHLVPLTVDDLEAWRATQKEETDALDWLYQKHLRRTER